MAADCPLPVALGAVYAGLMTGGFGLGFGGIGTGGRWLELRLRQYDLLDEFRIRCGRRRRKLVLQQLHVHSLLRCGTVLCDGATFRHQLLNRLHVRQKRQEDNEASHEEVEANRGGRALPQEKSVPSDND